MSNTFKQYEIDPQEDVLFSYKPPWQLAVLIQLEEGPQIAIVLVRATEQPVAHASTMKSMAETST